MGQQMMAVVESMEAVDDLTFTIQLKETWGLVLAALGKMSSNVPFMMPKRLAETDPFEQVPDSIGSGPYVFVKDEWVPGSKVVYTKNQAYIPRDEPPSAAAGGKQRLRGPVRVALHSRPPERDERDHQWRGGLLGGGTRRPQPPCCKLLRT